jgi:hypothetical protein
MSEAFAVVVVVVVYHLSVGAVELHYVQKQAVAVEQINVEWGIFLTDDTPERFYVFLLLSLKRDRCKCEHFDFIAL